jgi:acyl-CoA synthetase (AMP-forming)/AMP-acid ligase II
MVTDSAASSLLDYLEKHAQSNPDRICNIFVGDDGLAEISLTFAMLRHRSLAIAATLQNVLSPAKGFRNGALGERVILMYSPGVDFLCAFYGCLYSGAVAIPGATMLVPA